MVDEGAGPPVVLLHAGVADLRAWDDVVPPLIAAGYRAVRYDARGHGPSPTDDIEFSQRADVLAVLDALGIGRAALVGNSRGGMIAIDTAIESPDRVAAVVTLAAGIGGFDSDGTPEEQELFERYRAVDTAEPFDAAALTAFEVGVWADGPGQPAGRASAPVRERLYAMNLPLNAPGRVRGHDIDLEPPATGRLAELRCPVLAIAGGLDFTETVEVIERLQAEAPNARGLVWDDVAHMIGMEQPDRLAGAIVEFLAPLDRWA